MTKEYSNVLAKLFSNWLRNIAILGTSGDNEVRLFGECDSREGDSFER